MNKTIKTTLGAIALAASANAAEVQHSQKDLILRRGDKIVYQGSGSPLTVTAEYLDGKTLLEGVDIDLDKIPGLNNNVVHSPSIFGGHLDLGFQNTGIRDLLYKGQPGAMNGGVVNFGLNTATQSGKIGVEVLGNLQGLTDGQATGAVYQFNTDLTSGKNHFYDVDLRGGLTVPVIGMSAGALAQFTKTIKSPRISETDDLKGVYLSHENQVNDLFGYKIDVSGSQGPRTAGSGKQTLVHRLDASGKATVSLGAVDLSADVAARFTKSDERMAGLYANENSLSTGLDARVNVGNGYFGLGGSYEHAQRDSIRNQNGVVSVNAGGLQNVENLKAKIYAGMRFGRQQRGYGK